MQENKSFETNGRLDTLCVRIKDLADKGQYQSCEQLIYSSMAVFPHAPQPHNLIGIILEKEGNHLAAMKHFRAAWALDPTYIPARQNLDRYGTFFKYGKFAYDENDCQKENYGVNTFIQDTSENNNPERND